MNLLPQPIMPPTIQDKDTAPKNRRLRVLVIAEAANPVLTSAALVAWSCSRALLDACDAHLVTELRNKEHILATGLPEDRVTFINARRLQHFVWVISSWLRRGKDLGWTTYAMFTTLVYPFFEQKLWRQFRSRLEAGEFDVVHRVHPLSPVTPSFLAAKLKKIGVPFVVGPLNGGVPWPEEFAHLRAKEKEWMGRFRSLPRYLPGYHSTRKNASALILAAESAWKEMPVQYHDKCVFLPENAIDPERFPEGKMTAPSLPLKVAFVGRLVPLKGVDMLIEAAAPLVRQGKLAVNIIGDGPERASLQKMAAELVPGGDVRINGWVPHEKLSGELGLAHVMVLPSVREFGGGVVLESMALGLVPIVLDWGGPPELVPDGCGFIVPMGSRDQIVKQLRDLLAEVCSNPAQLTPMAVKGQQHVRTHMTWNAKAAQLQEVYRWTLGERAEKPGWRKQELAASTHTAPVLEMVMAPETELELTASAA